MQVHDVGIGAVLSQVSDCGSERVIAYASRSLTRPEQRQYLLGREFTLRTDHGSLVWIRNFKEPEGQLARWLERLQEYNFTVVHRQGLRHCNADALSRVPCRQCGRDEDIESENTVMVGVVSNPFQKYTPAEMRQMQLDDTTIQPVHCAEATTVAKKLVDEMFCRFSPPEQLHSDQGRQFESDLVKEICELLQIRKTRTTPYHPQCNGMVERFNRTLLDMLSTAVGNHQADWQQHIRKLCLAYNSSVHSSTGFTPFFLMFGRQAKLPQRKNLVHDLGQDHGQDQGGMDYCGQIPQHLAPRSWP
ncbi:hypothetical protein EMCRGX_G017162 [Ephydatia muelleri]